MAANPTDPPDVDVGDELPERYVTSGTLATDPADAAAGHADSDGDEGPSQMSAKGFAELDQAAVQPSAKDPNVLPWTTPVGTHTTSSDSSVVGDGIMRRHRIDIGQQCLQLVADPASTLKGTHLTYQL